MARARKRCSDFGRARSVAGHNGDRGPGLSQHGADGVTDATRSTSYECDLTSEFVRECWGGGGHGLRSISSKSCGVPTALLAIPRAVRRLSPQSTRPGPTSIN